MICGWTIPSPLHGKEDASMKTCCPCEQVAKVNRPLMLIAEDVGRNLKP